VAAEEGRGGGGGCCCQEEEKANIGVNNTSNFNSKKNRCY
jgi:hypothetical protein